MAVRFRAAFDGGSRGNPGPAAWGVAVFDQHGECTEGRSGVIGRATNNVAEYHGLLEALKLAEEQGADEVELQADSELIVRQVEGRYRVRNAALKPLFEEAMRRIHRFKSFRLRHVRREFNRDADRLVNVALNRAGDRSEAPAP
jgi:ribonuclease HI